MPNISSLCSVYRGRKLVLHFSKLCILKLSCLQLNITVGSLSVTKTYNLYYKRNLTKSALSFSQTVYGVAITKCMSISRQLKVVEQQAINIFQIETLLSK